jgi:hypothetical protein
MNSNTTENRNTAVLVLSCDKYSDVWKPFFLFFQKYWSDCPFPVYLGTNTQAFSFENVTQVFSNKTTSWSDELDTILKQIPEKYVLIILEDYFIYESVNNHQLFDIIDIMEQERAAFIKLGAFPTKYNSLWPYKPLNSRADIGTIYKNSKYRLCLQTAIWNKEILLQLLIPDENPWQFEIEASKRSNELSNPFLCVIPDPKKKIVHGPITYYCTALSEGKWMRGAVELCKKENIFIDTTKRPIETKWEAWKRKAYIASPIIIRKGVDCIGNILSLK